MEEEHGITSLFEYFEAYDVFQQANDPNEFRDYVASIEYDLGLLFQVAPVADQDIVLVSLNPGLQQNMSPSIFEGTREFARRWPYEDDLEALAQTIARNLDGYLTSATGFKRILPRLHSELDIISSPNEIPYENWIHTETVAPNEPNVLSEMYFTRVYKFPTYGKGPLTTDDMAFGRRTLQNELQTLLDPQLYVCTGMDAWQAIHDLFIERGYEIKPRNESTLIRDSFKFYEEGGAKGGLYEVPEADSWILTTKHGSYPVNTDRLESNIRYLNAHL
ncbi:hypothetical protein [Natronosalvus vescus]|uniref:hypothetical protein n=1 Tax=Natronosalvus vescus TaxID=2953881 RepID=UPI0020914C97|nr:hypothetical protein [Natronosalvus vescus]